MGRKKISEMLKKEIKAKYEILFSNAEERTK